MNYEAILTARQQYETDEAFLAAANAEQVSYVESWIRYTTIAAQFGDAVAESLYAMLAETAPGKAAAYINPGFDMASAVTRQAMQAIADTTPEAAPVIAWCLQQGRVVTRPCEEWGVGEMTQAVLDEARRMEAIERASRVCDAARIAGQVQADVDPFDRAAVRAAMVAKFDEEWA
jgi:hypothetical protein